MENHMSIENRLTVLRQARPELGRLRLAVILATKWPMLIMTVVGTGNVIVRRGFGLPTLMIVFSLAGAWLLENHPGFNLVAQQVSLALMLVGTWAVFGVISVIFNMPLSEGVLSSIEDLVFGKGAGRRHNCGFICAKAAELAQRLGRSADATFFMQVKTRIEALEAEDAEGAESIRKTIFFLRKELTRSRDHVRAECLVYHFTEVFMIFIGTILCFSLYAQALSAVDPKHFEPAARMDFVTSLYYSFTVVTTTDFGDICPLSNTTRLLAVWEQCFGVAFVTAIIGAAMDVFRHKQKNATAKKRGVLARRSIRRRVFAFALRLFRDYEELSEPRRKIDDLLDDVEERAKRLRAAATSPPPRPA